MPAGRPAAVSKKNAAHAVALGARRQDGRLHLLARPGTEHRKAFRARQGPDLGLQFRRIFGQGRVRHARRLADMGGSQHALGGQHPRHTAPAAVSAAVTRPEKWPPPRQSSKPPYFTWAAQSAWPGRQPRARGVIPRRVF